MTLELRSLLHNRYRIEQIIAQGGMGAIYRATDESLGVEVAVKENLFTTEESTRQFRREATILAGLRHSNLPRVTDHFVVPGQGQYLVMDYIEGEDLRQIITRDGKIPESEVVYIGSVICDALSYLHSRPSPIIHRDIKPGNIKVTPTRQIYLVDFGLAKESQAGQATTIGAQALTPGYAPPEQYGQGTNPISDLYSLAATLYATLTGQIPEDGLARAMGSATLTPIRKLNPAVSERVTAVIEKAMSVDIAQRYQTAEEFKQALLSSNTEALQRRTQMNQKQTTGTTNPPQAQSPTLPRVKGSPGARQGTVVRGSATPAAKAALPVVPILIGGFIFLGIIVGCGTGDFWGQLPVREQPDPNRGSKTSHRNRRHSPHPHLYQGAYQHDRTHRNRNPGSHPPPGRASHPGSQRHFYTGGYTPGRRSRADCFCVYPRRPAPDLADGYQRGGGETGHQSTGWRLPAGLVSRRKKTDLRFALQG